MRVEHAIEKHISVVMWYADWANNEPNVEQLEAVAARGSTPEMTWEPWDALNAARPRPVEVQAAEHRCRAFRSRTSEPGRTRSPHMGGRSAFASLRR